MSYIKSKHCHAISRVFATIALLQLGITTCIAQHEGDEFQSLFDGETLVGWDGDPELWEVKDGVIKGTTKDSKPINDNQFLIWDGEVNDFVLRVDFRIGDRGMGNSGVQYRSKRYPNVGKWIVGGYQADIERTNKYMGILYEERGRGILALRGEKVVLGESDDKPSKEVVGTVGDPDSIVEDVRPGEWQTLEITAVGNQLVHKLNGRTTVSVIDNDDEHAASEGIVALQLHRRDAMQVEFREIHLKRLRDGEEAE